MTSSSQPIGPHDLGGLLLADGEKPIDREEHDFAHWERLVDGLIYVMGEKGYPSDTAAFRRAIESLQPGDYETLSYYERWAHSAATWCKELGLVTQSELDAKMAEIKARQTESDTR
jgi:hypothetical protein